MKKRILAFVLTLVLIMGLFPITASAAEEIKYMDWDDSSKTLVEKTATAEKLTAETNVENIAGWYYVDGNVEINSLIKVKKDNTAHIILTDGSKLTASQGIVFAESVLSASWFTCLYIYGQADGSGELVADGEIDCIAGQLTINGCTVTANKGINCRDGDGGGFIMINGGNVTATGGTNSVGIGNNTSAQGDAVKPIIINGGTVTATGGDYAAGIVGRVTINGGTVTATGGKDSAGIVGHDGSGEGVTINGGTVTATGDDAPVITGDLSVYALGKITDSDGNPMSFEDYMANREYFHIEPRTKESVEYMDWDSGKKEWVEKTVSAVKIDPHITALADGCWYYVDGHVDKGDEYWYDCYYPIRTEGTAYIILGDGCEFTVGAGIEVPSGKSLFIYGQELGTGELNVTDSISGIGIGGKGSTVTINRGIVCTDCSCEIGIGGEGSTVTINRGTVTVDEAWISGIGGKDSTVTINDGTVTATGDDAPGIGGKDSTVTINGGTVTATGDVLTGFGVHGGSRTVTINGGTATISGSKYGVCNASIIVTGDGVLTLSGSTMATNVAKENINATVQTSKTGTTYADWDETTALSTYKYLKLTAAHTHTHTLNKVEAKDATCTEDGVKTAYWVCTGEGGCGKCFTAATDGTEISTETLAADYIEDAKGHNFSGDAVSNNNGTHSFKCINSDCTAVGTMDNTMPVEYEESVKGYVTCSGGTATCTAKAACSTCTAEYGDVLGHDFKEQVIDNDHLVSAATCTAKAVYYYDCSRCDVKSDKDTFEYGNMLDHSYKGDYVDNGNGTHSRKCVNGCNAYGNPTAHTGMEDFICDDCGYTELEKAKEAAIAELTAVLPEDANDEQKEIYQKACEDIEKAENLTAVIEIKEAAIKDIEAAGKTELKGCANPVSGFCNVYNQFIDIPVLNVIFKMLHQLIHAIKAAF